MSLRADRIKRARRRVDARRAALGNYADRARDDYRRTYSQNLGRTKFRPTKPKVGGAGDVVLNTIREAGGDLKKLGTNVKDALFPVAQIGMKGLDVLMSNIDRSRQNRKILGDVYTDDLRKSMMTDDDLEFYNKYIRLADLTSDQDKRQEYLDTANTALQNAQITNRINYALGQPEFGFETTAPAGIANIDYSTLVDRMVHGTDDSVGLAGTAAGKAFLADAYRAQADETGDSLIGNAIMNYGDAAEGRGGRVTPEMLQPTEDVISIEDLYIPPTEYSNQPNIDAYNEMMTAPEPFNAASIYPNLNVSWLRNKVFPGMALEDITQEDLNNLSLQDRVRLGYTG